MKRVSKIKIGYSYSSSDSEVPIIRLMGQYLRQFDFDVGDSVIVTMTPARIEIVKPCVSKEEFKPLQEPDRVRRLMKIGELSGRSEMQVLRFLGNQSVAELSDESYAEAVTKLINKPVGIFTKADIHFFLNHNQWSLK